jgi:hypothetical protein
MEAFITKQEAKLYKALQLLIHNSVDSIGLPKRATVKQLQKANKVLTDYENYERSVRAKAKTDDVETKDHWEYLKSQTGGVRPKGVIPGYMRQSR